MIPFIIGLLIGIFIGFIVFAVLNASRWDEEFLQQQSQDPEEENVE